MSHTFISHFICLGVAAHFLVSCGFTRNRANILKEPVTTVTPVTTNGKILPPSPVIGSFLTGELLQKDGTPLVKAKVSILDNEATASQKAALLLFSAGFDLATANVVFETETDEKGRFALPVDKIKTTKVALKVRTSNRLISSEVVLPPDLAVSVSQSRVGAGLPPLPDLTDVETAPSASIVDRKLGLQIPENRSSTGSDFPSDPDATNEELLEEAVALVATSLPSPAQQQAKSFGMWTTVGNESTDSFARFQWSNIFGGEASVKLVFSKSAIELSSWDGRAESVPLWGGREAGANVVTSFDACTDRDYNSASNGPLSSTDGSKCGFDRNSFPFSEKSDVFIRVVGESSSEIRLSPIFLISARNTAPTVTVPSNLETEQGTSLSGVRVTIKDNESTLSCNTALNLRSSNSALIPDRSIFIGGVAPDCSVTFVPLSNQWGNSTISVVANDGSLTASGSFQITVRAFNAKPIVTANSSISYTEQSASSVIEPSLLVSDTDSLTLSGASVSISSGFTNGDVLSVSPPNGITSSYDPQTGTLTLSGSASLKNYENALRSVSYSSTSDHPTEISQNRIVTWLANDGSASNALSLPVTSSISIVAVNDSPFLTAGTVVNYIEQESPVSIQPALTISDSDSDQITSATIQISGGLTLGDELGFTPANGILGSYDSMTGILTLSGMASVASYTATMRTVTFNSSSNNPTFQSTNRTITWRVTDNQSVNIPSVDATSTILVMSVNDSPVVTANSSISYTEQSASSVIEPSLLVSDTDSLTLSGARVAITSGLTTGDELVFDSALGITGSYDPALGNLILSGTASLESYVTVLRSVRYRSTSKNPTALSGNRTISWTVDDGEIANHVSAAAQSYITVIEIADPPEVILNSPAIYTEQESPVLLASTLLLSDVDSTTQASAEVRITSGFTSGDTLSFSAPALSGIAGTFNSSTGVLSLSGISSIANYQAALRSVTFNTPSDRPTSISSNRTIAWKSSDGQMVSLVVNTNISVIAVNDAPILSNISDQTVNEDTPFSKTVTLSDPDSSLECYHLTITSSKTALFGSPNYSVSGTIPNCVINLSPASNQHGEATITISASDGYLTTQTSFNVTVNPVFDAPQIGDVYNFNNRERELQNIMLTMVADGRPDCTQAISGTSSNTELLPNSGIVFGGVYPACSMSLNVTDKKTGVTIVTLTVSDGSQSAQDTFELEILPTWSTQAFIKASNSDTGDYFGSSVTLSGNTLAVGATSEASNQNTITNGSTASSDDSSTYTGAVYVFRRTGANWVQEAYVKAANADTYDRFGSPIVLSGNTLVVGVPEEDSNAFSITNGPNASADNSSYSSGAVFVYQRSGSTWSQEAYVKAVNANTGDEFGKSVSLAGDTLAVGSHWEDSNQTTITSGSSASSDNTLGNSGAVYIYSRIGTTWSQEAYIKASNAGDSDYFGNSVALSSDTLAVGAKLEDSSQSTITQGTSITLNNQLPNAGAVYIFRRSAGTWTQIAFIKSMLPRIDDNFGHAVSISGDSLAVGIPFEDSYQSTISSGTSTSGGVLQFGGSTSNSGAVSVFRQTNDSWSQEAYIKAPNRGLDDNFGQAVSLAGNALAVGAPNEDTLRYTNSYGDSVPSNEYGTNWGAVYLYKRSGPTWLMDAYIKPINYHDYNYFGSTVSISGDSIAVGSPGDGSGENSISTDDPDSLPRKPSSGAAYIFHDGRRMFEPDVLLSSRTADSVSFSWEAGIGSGIAVKVAPAVSGNDTAAANCVGGTLLPEGTTSYTYTGLSAGSKYGFRFCAWDGTNASEGAVIWADTAP